MGRMHANVYGQMEDVEVVGIADHRPERRDKYAAEFGFAGYETIDELVDRGGAQVIDVCLPTFLHKDATIHAASRGCHVFCEKPMALNLDDADEMIATTESAGVQLMIGHCIRFWPEYAHLKGLQESGELGDLLSVNLTRYGEFPFWSSDNWLGDESKSGGGVLDMHIHDTDFALYLFGEPDAITSHGTVDERGAGHAFTTFRFGNRIVHAEGGWNFPSKTPFKMAFRAVFERGAAIMDGGPLTIYRQGAEPEVPEFPKMSAAGGGNISDLGGYYLELRYFFDRLNDGQPLRVVTPQSSRASLAACLEEIRQIKAAAG